MSLAISSVECFFSSHFGREIDSHKRTSCICPSDDTLPATLFAVLKIPDRSDDPDLFDERRVWRQRQELGETLPPFFVLHGATSSRGKGGSGAGAGARASKVAALVTSLGL